jgi:hypothetical protein
LLEQGSSGSQDIQKLFWFAGSAQGPESTADPAGHNNTIVVFVHENQLCSCI